MAAPFGAHEGVELLGGLGVKLLGGLGVKLLGGLEQLLGLLGLGLGLELLLELLGLKVLFGLQPGVEHPVDKWVLVLPNFELDDKFDMRYYRSRLFSLHSV